VPLVNHPISPQTSNFSGLLSAAVFGHPLTLNFAIGISIVLVSMHQFFADSSPAATGAAKGKFGFTASPSLEHLVDRHDSSDNGRPPLPHNIDLAPRLSGGGGARKPLLPR